MISSQSRQGILLATVSAFWQGADLYALFASWSHEVDILLEYSSDDQGQRCEDQIVKCDVVIIKNSLT